MRQLMNLWAEKMDQDKAAKIQSILDNSNFVFFFIKNQDIFAAPEDSRLMFAKMKKPDPEDPPTWKDEATFSAFNMNKALEGQRVENIFSQKDIRSITVVDRDTAFKILSKKAVPGSDKKLSYVLSQDDDPDVPPNMTQLGDNK